MKFTGIAACYMLCHQANLAASFQIHKLSFIHQHQHTHTHTHTQKLSQYGVPAVKRNPAALLRAVADDDEQSPSASSSASSSSSPPPISSMAFKTESNNEDGTSTTVLSEESVTKALKEARELKVRATKQRLEAEKLSIQLTLDKIESLELQLSKLNLKKVMVDSGSGSGSGSGSDSENGDETEKEEEKIKFDKKLLKKSEDLKLQIQGLRKQYDVATTTLPPPTTTSTSTATPTTKSVDTTTPSPTSAELLNQQNTSTENNNTNDIDIKDLNNIPPMPKETFTKRSEAFKRFPPEVKALYAKAVGANEDDDIDTIVEKLYTYEQVEKIRKEQQEFIVDKDLDDGNGNDDSEFDRMTPTTLLDIANALAGFSTLPPPIQEMISESVGCTNERNTTIIIEKLIESNKVKPTGDFGGVEFAMGDPDENEEENRGKDRDFTTKELQSAIDLFDNLPLPMKSMLASGVGLEDGSNSTIVIEKMIAQKKILPSKEGVEFVVTGDKSDDLLTDSMEMIESDNYVRTMLPDCMRNEGNMPSVDDTDLFFTSVLGRRTFNPTEKPIPLPGGYIIRGENKMKTNNELVVALEKAIEESSLKGKIQPYLIRDPTLVTEEQFESGSFELPVVLITGPNISPKTNRLTKPLVTVLGAFCIASFSLAVCLQSGDEGQDPVLLEQMVSPLILSILFTQVAHEAAHQLVAFKDKFKTGAATIVPSLQLGLTGGITPLKSPPPSFNSLFDFAISGPLVGLFLSLGLLYTGLEQQVFMDAAAQSQLPSLPVELLRSSALAGSLVEYLLGDGVLLSPDPAALIRLHPLAIAGFVGIVSNALSLLPIGNTDGGRLSLSLFGRSVSRIVRTGTIGIIVFSSFFGGDSVNLLLFYTIYAQIWQRESEIPCKNEIDMIDNVRAAVALGTGILVGLSVIPMM